MRPREVRSPRVRAQARIDHALLTANLRGEWALGLADAGRIGLGVLIVEVIAPDGKPRPHYGGNLTARDGRAEAAFRTALNDPPGRWTIRAADYVSGVSGSATFDLGKRGQ